MCAFACFTLSLSLIYTCGILYIWSYIVPNAFCVYYTLHVDVDVYQEHNSEPLKHCTLLHTALAIIYDHADKGTTSLHNYRLRKTSLVSKFS